MSTNPPEGIYPGCTALSGLVEPGRAIVLKVPGYNPTVQAIAASSIRSPENLVLTIDSAGTARVFGVGSVQQINRTTDFYRSVRRSVPVRLIEWLIHCTKTTSRTGITPLFNGSKLPAEEFHGQLPGQSLHYRGKGTSESAVTISAEFQPGSPGQLQAVAIAEIKSGVTFKIEASLNATPPPQPTPPPGARCELPDPPPCDRLDYIKVEIYIHAYESDYIKERHDPLGGVSRTVEHTSEPATQFIAYAVYPQAAVDPPNDGLPRFAAIPRFQLDNRPTCRYGKVRFFQGEIKSRLGDERWVGMDWNLNGTIYDAHIEDHVSTYSGPYKEDIYDYIPYQYYEPNPQLYYAGFDERTGARTADVIYTLHYAHDVIQHGSQCQNVPRRKLYDAELSLQIGIVEAASLSADLNDLIEPDYGSSPYVTELQQLNKQTQFFYQLLLRKSTEGNIKMRLFEKGSLNLGTGTSTTEPYSPEKFTETFMATSGTYFLIVKASLSQQEVEDASARFSLLIQPS